MLFSSPLSRVSFLILGFVKTICVSFFLWLLFQFDFIDLCFVFYFIDLFFTDFDFLGVDLDGVLGWDRFWAPCVCEYARKRKMEIIDKLCLMMRLKMKSSGWLKDMSMFALNHPILLRCVNVRMLIISALLGKKISHREKLSSIVNPNICYCSIELGFHIWEKIGWKFCTFFVGPTPFTFYFN